MKQCCLFLLVMLCAAAVQAQSGSLVLFDKSGSMVGFIESGAMYSLLTDLAAMHAPDYPARVAMFSYGGPELTGTAEPWREVPLDDAIPVEPYGQDSDFVTPLEHAMSMPDVDMLFLVTDNVQDEFATADAGVLKAGDSADGITPGRMIGMFGLFYKLLADPRLARVEMIPATLHFQGKAYLPLQEFPDRSEDEMREMVGASVGDAGNIGSVRRLKRDFSIDYEGPKGVMIYALLLDSAREQMFRDILARFCAQRRLPRLLVKPFTPDLIALKGIDDTGIIRQRTDSYVEPTLQLSANGAGRYALAGGSTIRDRTYQGIAYLEFVSRFENLAFQLENVYGRRIELDIRSPEPWSIEGFKQVEMTPDISPRVISDKAWEAGQSTSILYRLSIAFKKDDLSLKYFPLSEFFASAFRNEGVAKGMLDIHLRIPSGCLRIAPDVLDRYFTNSMTAINKIWYQRDPLEYLHTAPSVIALRIAVGAPTEDRP
ncbi:hypothetical protein JW905_11000 [bacterium]|nr:hypothetical protein [candidate division CSSED10-310 bacterium]